MRRSPTACSRRIVRWRWQRLRRTHLRGHPTILKRLLVHVARFNLSLVLRQLLPRGTPRGLQDLGAAARAALVAFGAAVGVLRTALRGLVAQWSRLGSPERACEGFGARRAQAA